MKKTSEYIKTEVSLLEKQPDGRVLYNLGKLNNTTRYNRFYDDLEAAIVDITEMTKFRAKNNLIYRDVEISEIEKTVRKAVADAHL